MSKYVLTEVAPAETTRVAVAVVPDVPVLQPVELLNPAQVKVAGPELVLFVGSVCAPVIVTEPPPGRIQNSGALALVLAAACAQVTVALLVALLLTFGAAGATVS